MNNPTTPDMFGEPEFADSSAVDANNFLEMNPGEVHFMVDIETLDVLNTAAITEIGAVIVSTPGDRRINRYFHSHCIDPRGTVSGETIQWRNERELSWITWDKAIKEEDLEMNPLHIKNVMRNFFGWIQDVCTLAGATPVLWCKGTDFDKAIIERAAKNRCGIQQMPWQYNKFFDVRTLLFLFPQFKVDKNRVMHNGLDDAMQQAQQLIQIAEYVSNLKALEQSME